MYNEFFYLYHISILYFSAYCGSLWLAALYCTVQIANILKQEDISEKYLTIFNKAKESFNAILWNGNFLNYHNK